MRLGRIAALCAAIGAACPALGQDFEPDAIARIKAAAPFEVGERYFGGDFVFLFDRKVSFKGRTKLKRGIALLKNGYAPADATTAGEALRNITNRSGCTLDSQEFMPGTSLAFSLRCDP